MIIDSEVQLELIRAGKGPTWLREKMPDQLSHEEIVRMLNMFLKSDIGDDEQRKRARRRLTDMTKFEKRRF